MYVQPNIDSVRNGPTFQDGGNSKYAHDKDETNNMSLHINSHQLI